MVKKKKKQIVQAEKEVLKEEMQKAFPGPEAGKESPMGIDKKKRIAEAVKAIIKSTQDEQEKLDKLKTGGSKN